MAPARSNIRGLERAGDEVVGERLNSVDGSRRSFEIAYSIAYIIVNIINGVMYK